MSIMIEIRPDAGAGFAMILGVQTNEDIADAVAAVIQLCHSRIRIRLLCDWSDVQRWDCEPRSLPMYPRTAVAEGVKRAVILHHHRWNRQAAWLGALLRRENVEVRSWPLREPERGRT